MLQVDKIGSTDSHCDFSRENNLVSKYGWESDCKEEMVIVSSLNNFLKVIAFILHASNNKLSRLTRLISPFNYYFRIEIRSIWVNIDEQVVCQIRSCVNKVFRYVFDVMESNQGRHTVFQSGCF